MNEKLKEFLDAKKEAEKKKYEAEKQKTLLELGLFDKVYAPDNKYSKEYYLYEWDDARATTKYFKNVPIEITDEEYQEVKKYLKKDTPENNPFVMEDNPIATESNPIATALTVIAWIVFIGGFIAGIVLGTVEVDGYYFDYTEFSFAIALIYWSVSLISGTMLLGFAEIIKLLNAIKKK